MNFALSDEQEFLKEAARGALSRVKTIEAARDALDGGSSDDDQGISPTTDANGNLVSNISPTAANGQTYTRATTAVLNIVYLNSLSVSLGGFFPAGVNGTTVASGAN